jgi:hypothetical protein
MMSLTTLHRLAFHASVLALAYGVVAWPRVASAQDPFGGAHYEEPPPRVDPASADPTDWDPALPAPAGYHIEHRVRRSVVIGGAGLFAIWYLPAAAVAAPAREPALLIPMAGPFIQLSQTPSSNPPAMILLVTDGVFQTMSAGIILYGVLLPRRVLVRDVGPAHVSIAPLSLGSGASGLGLVGTF